MIERASFVVENGAFVSVGRQGELTPPPRAVRVDLAGKTVMPAMIDIHTHLGYRKGATFSADNFTRENLVAELQRFAYGRRAVASAGTDRGVDVPAARHASQGGARPHRRSWLAPPDAGPGPPMRSAPHGVSSEAEARRERPRAGCAESRFRQDLG